MVDWQNDGFGRWRYGLIRIGEFVEPAAMPFTTTPRTRRPSPPYALPIWRTLFACCAAITAAPALARTYACAT